VNANDAYHSDGFGAEDFHGGECGEEGDVGQHINHSDQGARDGDGLGQVAHWVFQLLNNEIQVIPAQNTKNTFFNFPELAVFLCYIKFNEKIFTHREGKFLCTQYIFFGTGKYI
jgi:hypothetical protein